MPSLSGVVAVVAWLMAAPVGNAETNRDAASPSAPAAVASPSAAPSADAPSSTVHPAAPAALEVAWGCAPALRKTLDRVRVSAFSSWLRGVAVPKSVGDAKLTCAACTMDMEGAAACDWRAGEAASAPAVARGCPDGATTDVFGAVDVATFLQGVLLREPPSSNLPQMFRRLGLGELTQLCYGGHLRNDKAWEGSALLRAKPAPTGFLSTLGPPVTPQLPKEAGLAGAQTVCASIVPARLWNLLETLAAGAAPLQYTLLRVQLDVVEKNQNARLADDILGTKPALWTLYQDRKGDTVAVLEGADGQKAVTFLAAAIESLADLLPGLQLNVFKKAVTMATLTVPANGANTGGTLHLAFFKKSIVVATSAASLAPHLKKQGGVGRGAALRAVPATVFGTIDAAHEAPWLRGLRPEFRPPLIKNARGVWFFSPDPQGWRGSVEMTVERQTIGQ